MTPAGCGALLVAAAATGRDALPAVDTAALVVVVMAVALDALVDVLAGGVLVVVAAALLAAVAVDGSLVALGLVTSLVVAA